MTARAEQETTITFMRDDPVAHLHTSNTSDLHHLRKLASSCDFVTEVRGGDDWADFAVDAENFIPLLAIRKKRPRSEAQLAASRAAGARLAAAKVGGAP